MNYLGVAFFACFGAACAACIFGLFHFIAFAMHFIHAVWPGRLSSFGQSKPLPAAMWHHLRRTGLGLIGFLVVWLLGATVAIWLGPVLNVFANHP